MKIKLLLLFLTIFGFVVLVACRTETQTYTTEFSANYINGKKIEVLRKDNYEQSYGIISGIKWGNNHSFDYEFTIQPDDCQWKGESQQLPLKLLFCESDFYLKVRGEKVIVDTAAQATSYVVPIILYFRNIDKRYFFKLFGEQHFEPTDSLTYVKHVHAGCVEENIPIK